MPNINNLLIDTSEMPTLETVRKFKVNGEVGAEFVMHIIENGTNKYYNFSTKTFPTGHSGKDSDLRVKMSGEIYRGEIVFPAGAATYTIQLIVLPGTEIIGNKYVISKSITQQSADAEITFTAVTANTDNYATFPTKTSSGPLNGSGKFDFDWNVTNASSDAGGYGLRLTGNYQEIGEKYWYFTTTETVNGAVSPSDVNGGLKVIVDDLTDIGVNSFVSAVSGGDSLNGTPYVLAIDVETKTLTLNLAQTFTDGVTLTFKARGSQAISNAIGSTITFSQYPKVTTTRVSKTVRAGGSGTTVNLNGTYGIGGGDFVSISGVGIDNSASNKVTSISASSGAGSMVVENSQTLTAGTVIYFNDIYQVINFAGSIKIKNYPSANKTIYLDLDQLITVGISGL